MTLFVVTLPYAGRTLVAVDLTDIEVRYRGRSHGKAVAFRIGRHTHPKARPEQPDTAPPATGIDSP